MIIYDTEIQNLIPPKDGNLNPKFKYCKGWNDYIGMGLACAVIYDVIRQKYHVFDEYEIDDLQNRLEKTDLVVGFNNLKFDNNLLAVYDINIPKEKSYDILAEVARAAKTPNSFSGLSLDSICSVNFNTSKSGDGADAPKLYQRGCWGALFNYCLADVHLTKKVLDRIIETGHIINPRNNRWIRVRRPH